MAGQQGAGNVDLSQQVQELSREVAQSTGVSEGDVRKVLDCLGLSDLDVSGMELGMEIGQVQVSNLLTRNTRIRLSSLRQPFHDAFRRVAM